MPTHRTPPLVPADPDRPVRVRLSTPADLVAVVPELLGFTPTESLVVLALHEPRGRLGLTMRFDLPAAGPAGPELAREVAARLRHERASRTSMVVLTEQPGRRPHEALVRALAAALPGPALPRPARSGPALQDLLLVRQGQWTSYTCSRPCCPPTGTPVGRTSGSGLMAAERVLDGRVVVGSRAELAAGLAPALALGGAARRAQLDRAALDHVAGSVAVPARGAAALDDEQAARLAVALADIALRDELLLWVVDDAEQLLTLATALARRTVAPYDAPVCTLAAAAAYALGEGALANVALDRALATDPGYGLALLLAEALQRQVAPKQLRAALAGPHTQPTARRRPRAGRRAA